MSRSPSMTGMDATSPGELQTDDEEYKKPVTV